jgi:hypothetical protein
MNALGGGGYVLGPVTVADPEPARARALCERVECAQTVPNSGALWRIPAHSSA